MSETSPGAEPSSSAVGEGQVDYLAEPGSRPSRSGRKVAVVATAAAGLLTVAGAGAWAVAQLMGGGAAPAAAVPDDALAYVSLDLDPSAGQKVEALKTLRRFPALRDHVGSSGDDLRRWLFEGLTAHGPCKNLDFDADIAPWLGSRVAAAVLPGGDSPVPIGVVQVTDEDAAKVGVARIAACSDEPAPGTAVVGDYLVLAETDALARRVGADAEAGPLSEDGDFQRWVDEAGGAGIVTGYVSAAAPAALIDAGQTGAAGMPFSGDLADVRTSLAGFDGAAAVLRFDGGALEVETAATALSRLPTGALGVGDGGLAELPSSTAVGLGFPVGDGLAQSLLDAMRQEDPKADTMLDQMAAGAGLTLPEDLQTLLGDGVSVAVDSSIDLEDLFDPGNPETHLPVGVRISGDPAEIRPVLDKVLAAMGPAANDLTVVDGDRAVAVGVDRGYLDTLARGGDLGGQDAFRTALPDLADSSGGLFVDFDAGDWLTSVLEDGDDAGVAKANAEPLSALGVTGRVDGRVVHGLVRLTTD